jgi:hypothetical protein
MAGPWELSIPRLNIRRPSFDTSGIAEGFQALRGAYDRSVKEDQDKEISAAIAGGDLNSAEKAAYKFGDLHKGMSLRKQRLAESEDQRRATLGEAESKSRTQKSEMAAAEKQKDFQSKRVSNALMSVDRKDPEFKQKYGATVQKLRGMGYDVPDEYADPDMGYDMVLSDNTSFKDRAEMEKQQRSHALESRKLDIQEREVQSKSMTRNRNSLTQAYRVMRESTTPEQWQQNAGVINAVFGRPVEWSERPSALVQVQSAYDATDEFAPTPGETEIGMTREMKLEKARQKTLEDTYGPAKRGYKWNMDGTQTEVARPSKPVDKNMQKALNESSRRLDAAEKTLLRSSMITNAAGEKLGIGNAGRAYEDFETAALGVVYSMSGKQTTNAEMERFLRINKPQWNDSNKTIKYRTQRVRDVLKAISSGVEKGLDYDEAERLAIMGGGDKGGGGGPGVKGMSDDDLLRELNK